MSGIGLVVACSLVCADPACAFAGVLTVRLTETIGRSSLSSDSEPLFSNQRPVCFRCCFSVAAFFVTHSFTSRGVGGGRVACGRAAFGFFIFGFMCTPDFLRTTPLFKVNE